MSNKSTLCDDVRIIRERCDKMEYSYELIEIISNTCKNNISENINMLEDLYLHTKEILFKLEIEELCRKYNLCDYCYGKLHSTVINEGREFMGFDCNEAIVQFTCEDCGRIK